MKLDRNIHGEPMIRMGHTEDELVTIIRLIDDDWDDDDEEFEEKLRGYRRKLIAKLKTLRKETKHAHDHPGD